MVANASGFIGCVTSVSGTAISGTFAGAVTVLGAVNSNFDAQLAVSKTEVVSEFDAKVCVVLNAEARTPTATIQLPTVANSSGVPPFTVTFSGIGTASGARDIVQYRWFFNDIITQVSGGQSVEHTFNGSGSYVVTFRVMDSEGFMGFDTIRINTYSGISIDLPGLNISGVPQSGAAPFSTNFMASGNPVAGTNIVAYGWNFGQGKYSTRQNQSGITYMVPGQYVPVCTVIDSRGFRMSDSLEVGANN